MSLLKAVFFDLDGTLYSYDDADAVGTAALRRHVCERLDIDEDLFSHTFDQARRDVKAQIISWTAWSCLTVPGSAWKNAVPED